MCAGEIRTLEICAPKICASEICAPEIRALEICAPEIRAFQMCAGEIRAFKIGVTGWGWGHIIRFRVYRLKAKKNPGDGDNCLQGSLGKGGPPVCFVAIDYANIEAL
jgi:hypothetical protein